MDAVVEGTVLRSGAQVRITAQLIDAVADKHLWAQSYDGDLRDTLALQNTVARAIAEQIRISVTPQEQVALKHANVVNPDAYEAFLKGRYFWNKRTGEGLKRAKGYFDQAVATDPNYAQAYSGLADTYALLGDWQYAVMTAKEALPKAKAAAVRALELDNTLGEAHTSLAFILDGFDWGLGIRGSGIPSRYRAESGLRDRSSLVCLAFELIGPASRRDRGNEKSGKRGPAVPDHQIRSGGTASHRAFL